MVPPKTRLNEPEALKTIWLRGQQCPNIQPTFFSERLVIGWRPDSL